MKIIDMKFQYFNQCQNLYITAEGDNLIPKFEHVISIETGSHLHYGENQYGIVNFGLWYDDPKKRPGHGSYWSSRESVVGPLIGKNLISVSINRVGVSMSEDALTPLLPSDYHIVTKTVGAEIYHEIQRRDRNNEETPYQDIIGRLTPSYWFG